VAAKGGPGMQDSKAKVKLALEVVPDLLTQTSTPTVRSVVVAAACNLQD
jgi:hypothetical protein